MGEEIVPDWTQERKDEVVEQYKAANPTPETSMQIVKGISEELGDDYTPNGVMAILVKARNPDGSSVYIKKTAATGTAKSGETKRVSKADAVNELTEVIESLGLEADGDILGKLTGKAAVYFTKVIKAASEEESEED